MSEVHNNGVNNVPGNGDNRNEHITGSAASEIAFKGEMIDLRYDPVAAINKTCIKTRTQVAKDLEQLRDNPKAIEKASALYPAFHGHAVKKGIENPNLYALDLEHYAATEEFTKD